MAIGAVYGTSGIDAAEGFGRGSSTPEADVPESTFEFTVESFSGLEPDIVQRVVREHRREMRHCFEQELDEAPNLEGRVIVGFTVDLTGHVSDWAIEENAVPIDRISDCLVRRVRQWAFPEPRDDELAEVLVVIDFAVVETDPQ